MKILKILVVIFILFLFLILSYLYLNTGFLQKNKIDEKDLKYWKFDENGVINNAGSFFLKGNNGKCGVIVHGYTSTPDELRIISEAVNKEFNYTVYVPLLYGHGRVPSELQKYSVDEWYEQVSNLIKEKNCEFLLGSSMGASLVLRYSEENLNIKSLILSGILLKPEPSNLPIENLARLLLPIAGYLKKSEPGATIDEPSLRKFHISTHSFPIKGAVELIDFNENVIKDLGKVKSDVLFLHSPTDTVADFDAAKNAFELLNTNKSFIEFKGDHIIFRDYEKEKAVGTVLDFIKR